MADYRADIGGGPSHHIIRHEIRPQRSFVNYERERYRERERDISPHFYHRAPHHHAHDSIEDEREDYRAPSPGIPVYEDPDPNARAEHHIRDRPPPMVFPSPPAPTYHQGRSRSRHRHRVFFERISVQRVVATSEALFSESIREYYQNGEGIGAIETLLPEDSDDEGPRRLSSLHVTNGGCPHASRRKTLLSVSKLGSDSPGAYCECGKEKKPKEIRFSFALIRGGKFFQSQEVIYPSPVLHNHEKTDHGRRSEIKESFDDSWLAEKMSEAYARELRYFYLIPIRKISFATYIRIENLARKRSEQEWEYPLPCTTAKIGFMRSTQIKSRTICKRHFMHPDEYNRVAYRRLWLTKFDELIEPVDGDAEFIIELEEEWNFWFFFWLLILATALSAVSAILYSHYTRDVSTAISLASYIVTCLALLLALVAAGDYVGLQNLGEAVNFDYNSTNGDFDMATGKDLMEKLDANVRDKLSRSMRKGARRRRGTDVDSE